MKISQKGFIAPLLIIILLLVVGGGVYYSYSKKNTGSPGVYRNDKYGFEFSYPPYLILDVELISDVGYNPQNPNVVPGMNLTLRNSKPGLPDVFLSFSKNPPESWYPKFSDTCQPGESCLTTFGETADGVKTEIVTFREGPTEESIYSSHRISFFKNDTLIRISSTLNQALSFGDKFPNKEEANNDVDKITATFHFLK